MNIGDTLSDIERVGYGHGLIKHKLRLIKLLTKVYVDTCFQIVKFFLLKFLKTVLNSKISDSDFSNAWFLFSTYWIGCSFLTYDLGLGILYLKFGHTQIKACTRKLELFYLLWYTWTHVLLIIFIMCP